MQQEKTKNNFKIILLFSILLCFLFLKFFYLLFAPPLPDEAYYWLWAKRIDLSFYDHPPLSIWAQSMFSKYFSNKYFLIRIVPTLSFVFVLIISFIWIRRIDHTKGIDDYLKYTILLLSVPVFNVFLTISFPDPILICTLLTSGFFFHHYLERKNQFGLRKYLFWYIAVFFFSLALISKYNAILFGLGIVLYLVLSEKEKTNIIYSKHFLFSILMILIAFSPVILWNLNNDYASLGFNLNKRLSFDFNLVEIFRNLVVFLFSLIIFFSPIFVWNLYTYTQTKFLDEQIIFVSGTAKTVFLSTIIFCFFLAFFAQPLYYWAIPGFVLFIPHLLVIIRNTSHQIAHTFYGLALSIVLVFNVTVFPISSIFIKADRESAIIYGWDFITEIVSKEKKGRGISNVVFSDYRLASLYAFHSEHRSIDVFMAGRETQFDIWRKLDVDYGDSLILVDDDFPINSKISSIFKTVTFIRNIDVKIEDKRLKRYQIYLGVNNN
jgi:4-amino-4-deoxy-L-arabinose transferase-like glycosyltransferase